VPRHGALLKITYKHMTWLETNQNGETKIKKFAAAVALAASLALTGMTSARAEDTDDKVTKVTIATVVITTCVVPELNKESPKDQRYLSDVMYVFTFMSHGVDDKQVNARLPAVQKYIDQIGKEAFCRENKRQLDNVVDLAREKWPSDLDKNWRDAPRWTARRADPHVLR
jgi:hypothetical protein